MVRGLFLPGLLIVALLLQVTILDLIRVAGVKPDLVLILVVFNALLRGQLNGALWGFGAGLMEDVATGCCFGLNALVQMAVGYLAGMARTRLYVDSGVMVAVVTLLVSLFGGVVHYLLFAYVDIFVLPKIALLKIIFPGAVYNALMALLLSRWFYRSRPLLS